MGNGDACMVNSSKTAWWIPVAITVGMMATPAGAETCSGLGMFGGVKSVRVTEAFVDGADGKIGEAVLVERIDVSRDARSAETQLYSRDQPPTVKSTLRSEFESGRLIRQTEVQSGKTLSTTECSYDKQGRVVELRTQSDGELNIHETYEYGPRFVRRRATALGGISLLQQTLDAQGRVVKEELLDASTSLVDHTVEHTYLGNQEEQCWIYRRETRRQCSTIIRDSHGNEIEFRALGQSRLTTIQYDSLGNWISKRSMMTGPSGTTVETIVRRTIEYW